MWSDPFSPATGESGGLETGDIESARNIYAEQSVWQENELDGYYDEQYNALGPLQNVFDVSGKTGISNGLGGFFDAVSAWAQSPNDQTARGNVMTAANQVCTDFQQTFAQLSESGSSMVAETQSIVGKINTLTADIAKANQSMLESQGSGNGDDAGLYSDLEQLSALANVSYVSAGDGTFTVLLDGQIPLVMGTTAYSISAQTVPSGGAVAPLQILDSANQPITSSVTGGRLGADLSAYNGTLVSLLGDGTTPGTLNTLASEFASQVNSILQAGEVDNSVSPAVMGGPLFSISGTPAETIQVDPTASAATLAAIDPGPPATSNGVPLKLASLSTAVNSTLNMSFSAYLAKSGSDLGTAISTASTSKGRQDQLLSQAKSLRGDIQGVDLNEEAAQLMAFQQSYSATARVFSTVDQMLDTLMNIVQ
jgi:flagellar hook-associated protein 1 FlgK